VRATPAPEDTWAVAREQRRSVAAARAQRPQPPPHQAHASRGAPPLTRAHLCCLSGTDPSTSNIQKQANGFGAFVQKFQKASGKSKYGMPIFLPNGNVNPAYLAAERAEARAQSTKNTKAAEAKRKNLIGKKSFELADYVRKKVGEVGSGKDYYQSGR